MIEALFQLFTANSNASSLMTSFPTSIANNFTNALALGYLSGSGINKFPKPLSETDEREAIQSWQKGDENARNKLIEHNLRLVAHIAKKYASSGRDMDDMISIGVFGLTKAVMTYNPDKNIKLVTYASKCIENEILMYLRSGKKRIGEISLQDSIGTDKDGSDVSLLELLTSDDEPIEDMIWLKARSEKVCACVEYCLSERERQIILMRYGLGGAREFTQREIAAQMGISRSYVSRIEKKALEKLKAELIASHGL